ncbi:ABC transporter ATP-binding protein [Microbacterium aureliae]
MTDVILTRDLTKHYGPVHALDGLDLRVAAGQVHGFLGPNGAGKSTTIRILLGLARKTDGFVEVFGSDPWQNAAELHHSIAYVPGDVSVWPNLSGGEAIDFLSRLRGAGRRDRAYRERKDRLIEAFQFDPRKKGRSYSKGNRQKVALIAAFAVPAELYILDEPTSGLDPLMDVVFRSEVRRVTAAGATVLLSSHILSEVEHLCDHVSIIRAGRIVETGTLRELRHLTRTEVAIESRDPGAVAGMPGVHDVSGDNGLLRFTVDTDALAGVLPALAAQGAAGLRIAPPSLEDLFLRHYGDDLREGAAAERAEPGASDEQSRPSSAGADAGPSSRRLRRDRRKGA